MASSPKKNCKQIALRLSMVEYEKVRDNMTQTTCRSFSEYAIKVITDKPVTVYYRSKSFDEFIEESIDFRKQMDALFASGSLSDLDMQMLMTKVKDIKDILSKIYDYVRHNIHDNQHL